MEDENTLIPEETSRPPTTPVEPVKKRSKWGLGCLLSIPLLCFVAALVLAIGSVGMNAYLVWDMAGLEIALTTPDPNAVQAKSDAVAPTPAAAVQVVVVSEPIITPTPIPAQPTSTPTPIPQAPTATPTITWIDTNLPESQPTGASSGSSTNLTSNNTYKLIPIKKEGDDRPPAEHGDLNLKLRDPQPSDAEAKLMNYSGDADPNAPKLSDIFEPNFVRTYTAHDWDWNCNCKGALKNDGYLVGIKTTPGEPVYIPPSIQDIYDGKYYAVVLYAAEDTLTIVYNDVDIVAKDYVVHYLGLQTDPNLLAVFEQSTRTERPGLTLHTPVGLATDELIVSVRDKGTFMDTRSRKDWWD